MNRKNPELIGKLKKTTKKITEAPYQPSLKTHKAGIKTSPGKAEYSWINGEYRVAWNWSKRIQNTIIFIDFGTHKEVYQ